MSDESTSTLLAELSPEAMGTFDAEGNYIPRTITEDDLGGAPLEDVMADTIVEFDDGDLVEGTVVKIDRDEVCSTSASSPRASSRPRSCRSAMTPTPRRS